MVEIRTLADSDIDAIENLAVNSEQVKYVGTIEKLLSEKEHGWNYHVITDSDKVVGFFNIDTEYSDRYPFTIQGELGLRAFFVDSASQGKGYGSAAVSALGDYLKESYPDRPSIALTVSCKNPGAYKCYLTGGFLDNGELYHGGKAGPQHIMRMELNSANNTL
jgi:GNAT superfamily N-acetyltransferase